MLMFSGTLFGGTYVYISGTKWLQNDDYAWQPHSFVGGGVTYLLLAFFIWPLTTHPFRDGAPFLLLMYTSNIWAIIRFFPCLHKVINTRWRPGYNARTPTKRALVLPLAHTTNDHQWYFCRHLQVAKGQIKARTGTRYTQNKCQSCLVSSLFYVILKSGLGVHQQGEWQTDCWTLYEAGTIWYI